MSITHTDKDGVDALGHSMERDKNRNCSAGQRGLGAAGPRLTGWGAVVVLAARTKNTAHDRQRAFTSDARVRHNWKFSLTAPFVVCCSTVFYVCVPSRKTKGEELSPVSVVRLSRHLSAKPSTIPVIWHNNNNGEFPNKAAQQPIQLFVAFDWWNKQCHTIFKFSTCGLSLEQNRILDFNDLEMTEPTRSKVFPLRKLPSAVLYYVTEKGVLLSFLYPRLAVNFNTGYVKH